MSETIQEVGGRREKRRSQAGCPCRGGSCLEYKPHLERESLSPAAQRSRALGCHPGVPVLKRHACLSAVPEGR